MVSQPVCGASGTGHTTGAHAAGLGDRGAPPSRTAARSLPIAGRAVRALCHAPKRLKHGTRCPEATMQLPLVRCKTLHAVVSGPSVGQKMASAKRGFASGTAGQLNNAL